MLPALLAIAAVLGALVANRQRRRAGLPAQAVILSPRESTVVSRDGAVRSVQSAELTVDAADLEWLLSPESVENLARTYWRFLSRVTLGFIRVIYGENERRVVLLARPLTLLRFEAPEYVFEPGHGNVCWRIRDGLLVARAGRGCGFLALDVRHLGEEPGGRERLRIEVSVANFYPAIAAGFSTPVYEATQSAVHVLVTHAYLRSLASLHLAKSKVGRFATSRPDAPNPLQPESCGA
ncbi:MAG: hypothetical protein JO168_27375 [Solirubrobacterales bacterium]|nr:hypothetical protein [Solirubrobacterales bacterium]MBV9716730.1 hypothetical protein [Solirubrobacterales bacterium]